MSVSHLKEKSGPGPPTEKKKMYKNIFKAEVDLWKSLELYGKAESQGKTPIAKPDGILTERQRLWTSGKPNESHIENPVFYRYLKLQEYEIDSQQDSASEIEAVRGLQSDEIEQERSSSGVINRIQASRKERHEACLEELYQELGVISQELEPRVAEASTIVKEYLDQDMKDIEQILQRIKEDKDLFYFSQKDLSKLWEEIKCHSDLRQSWIEQLGSTLSEYEEQRSVLIHDVFRSYTESLLRIAHLMPPDVHRLMEDECMKVNVSLLENKRSRTDLMRRLLTADVERERQQYLYWEGRIEDWKELKVQNAIKSFESFMSSKAIVDPPSLTSILNTFVTEQKALSKRRLDLLLQVKEMRPPNATRPSVLKWHQSFAAVTDKLDTCNAKYKGLLDVERGKIIQKCEQELNRTKLQLFNEGVMSEQDIDQISTDHLAPLIGGKKSRFDYETEKMEKYLEDTTAEQKQHFQALFTYLQGLAHLWDSHELGLVKEERNLKDKLDKIRKEHDGQNQIREAKLDIVMDRLRQDSTEDALRNSLRQATTMLEEIKKSYLDFHSLQLKTAQEYPSMVSEEMQRYDESLCNYLGVSRLPPKKASHMSTTKSKDSVSRLESSLREKGKKDAGLDIPEEIVLPKSRQTYWSNADAQGSSFFRDLTITDASVKTNYTFVTETQDGDVEVLPYIESFKVPFDSLVDLKKYIRQEFLEHLETWKKSLMDKSDIAVQTKVEEINNELDLRLHLHEPRQTRAERDVHNVRAAELILHRERINEHCQGVLNELHELKSQFTSMVEEQKQEAEEFKRSVEDLEGLFAKAGKSHELLAVQDQVSGKLDKYMVAVRASLRKFRQDLDEMLNKIRSSNANCRKSLKIFSEGGNFSPDELEEYRKKLEKVANKIDSVEGTLMGDLEGMETKRLESAQDAAGKLEDRFKYHLFDLTFLEKTSRWLTNIQLKIKSEVADSNSQAQTIAKAIVTFDRRIDSVKQPNVDKERITAKQLHETLLPLIELFHSRTKFLNCGINDALVSLSALRMELAVPDESLGKRKSESGRKSRKGKRGEEPIVRVSSRLKGTRSRTPTEKIGAGEIKSQSPRPDKQVKIPVTDGDKEGVAASRKNESAGRTKQGGKYDRKYMVFGDEDTSEEDNFHGHVQTILRDSLDGILTTAEYYYRQKGSRQPTRSPAIQDNFDHCAEAFIQRLRSYSQQTDEYHNSCIQEFRSQIKKFCSSLESLPPLLLDEFYKEYLVAVESSRHTLQKAVLKKQEGLDRRKKEYYTLLRPTLGHPKNRADREQLCQKEETRRNEMSEFINEMKTCHQGREDELGIKFITHLNAIVLNLITEFDAVITTDEVIVGNVKPKKKSQKQLIREKLTKTEEGKTEETAVSRGPGVWRNLPVDVLLQTKDKDGEDHSTEISSRKRLQAHEAVIQARDHVFEDYKAQSVAALEDIQNEAERLITEEVRWKENWDRSLTKILDLY